MATGIARLWLPLANGDPPAADRRPSIAAMLATVGEVLRDGGAVFLHCSAGIHRTGMIAYALLRSLGFAARDAELALGRLRDITAQGVGPHRLAWGEQFAPRAE